MFSADGRGCNINQQCEVTAQAVQAAHVTAIWLSGAR